MNLFKQNFYYFFPCWFQITQLKIDHNPFAKGFRDNYDSYVSHTPTNVVNLFPPASGVAT